MDHLVEIETRDSEAPTSNLKWQHCRPLAALMDRPSAAYRLDNCAGKYQLPVLLRTDACDLREDKKRLDVVPQQFRVIVTHRPKFACRACSDGVVQESRISD
jgi:hypothetical protein